MRLFFTSGFQIILNRMHCQMRVTICCLLLVVSMTTGNSLPKDANALNVGRVKEAEDMDKVETKRDLGPLFDFASVDDEYSNSITDESIPSCPEIFFMTDVDGDGCVTEAEYRHVNPNMTDEEVEIIFQTYDPDADGIYIEDICNLSDVTTGQLPEPIKVDCKAPAIKVCDQEFYLVVDKEVEAEDEEEETGDKFCQALEAHIECVQRKIRGCDLDSYLKNLTEMRSGLCPDMDPESSVETFTGIPSTGVRQVRSARHGHRSRLGNSLRDANVDASTLARSSHSCLRSRMHPCNTNFISSLREGNLDPCETLISYRRCARKSTRKCPDKTTAIRIKDGIKSITRAHRRAKLCQ
ncbi:uncharacterized protein [Diadema antillarum]|uniref:uncharacterized protein isoform X1 n=2 Tax=Diadema antillarum TaxID=105358 RepID=UPI003A855E9B